MYWFPDFTDFIGMVPLLLFRNWQLLWFVSTIGTVIAGNASFFGKLLQSASTKSIAKNLANLALSVGVCIGYFSLLGFWWAAGPVVAAVACIPFVRKFILGEAIKSAIINSRSYAWLLNKAGILRPLIRHFFSRMFAPTFNYTLFVAVVFGVYKLLKAGKETLSTKKQYEALGEDLKKEGLNTKRMFELIAYSIKLGTMIAGVIDLGSSVMPKDFNLGSAVGEIFLLMSRLMSRDVPNDGTYVIPPGHSTFNPDGSPITTSFEGPEMSFMQHMKDLFDKMKQVVHKYRWRFTTVLLASIVGACLFVYVHYGDCLDWSVLKREHEAKGKNKKGRGAMKQTFGNSKPRQVKKSYIIYDETDISELWVDGTPKDMRDYFGKPLGPGKYVIVKAKANSNGDIYYVDEEFDILDPEEYESLHESLVTKSQVTFKNSQKENGTVTTKMTTKEVEKQTARAVDRINEALVHSNPIYKTDKIRPSVLKLLDAEQKLVVHAVSTSSGVLMNKHAFDRVVYYEFQGKVSELNTKSFKQLSHKDLILLPVANGTSFIKKADFELPSVGQKVTIVHSSGHSFGPLSSVDETPEGCEVVVNASTEPGWCGSPYINQNGRVVAIHCAAGKPGRDNIGIAITKDIIEMLYPLNSKK